MVKQRGPSGLEAAVPIDKYRKSIGKQNRVWTSDKSIKRHLLLERRKDQQPETGKHRGKNRGSSGTGGGSGGPLSSVWGKVSVVSVVISLFILVYYLFAFVLLPTKI